MLTTAMGKTESSRGEALQVFWRRFIRNKGAVAGGMVALTFIVSAIFAPYLAPEKPDRQNLALHNAPPSLHHLLGADQLGRDMLSRLLYGGRTAFQVGIVAVGIGVVLGLIVGMSAGYIGGWVDEVLMRMMDVLLAFPYLLLAIAIVAAIGPGILNTMIAIGIWITPTHARLIRGVLLSAKEAEYVEAARALGTPRLAILWRHLLPNCLSPVLVQSTLDFARAVLLEAGLSFLGYGVQPPTPSWGEMIASGRNEIFLAPHIVTFPGLAILLAVLSLNLVCDGLRDALDPRLK